MHNRNDDTNESMNQRTGMYNGDWIYLMCISQSNSGSATGNDYQGRTI